MNNGLEIDWETADRIVVTSLKNALEIIQTELNNHINKGAYMHPDDVSESVSKLIPSLKTLICYYGGSYE